MKIEDRIKKCVCFVALQKYDGEFKLVGTSFFVGRDTEHGTGCYAVTAKHVIDGIKQWFVMIFGWPQCGLKPYKEKGKSLSLWCES